MRQRLDKQLLQVAKEHAKSPVAQKIFVAKKKAFRDFKETRAIIDAIETNLAWLTREKTVYARGQEKAYWMVLNWLKNGGVK